MTQPPSGQTSAAPLRFPVRVHVTALTPLQFADRVGISRDTVYRHLGSASLPDRYVIFAGPRKILISPEAVEHFLAHWRLTRGAS